MILRSLFLRTLVASILLSFSANFARAASVTWSTPQQISGVTDVSTTGNLVGAFNVGGTGVPSTAPINGVVFQSFAAPGGAGSSGNFAMSPGGGGVFTNNSGGSANNPFASLPSAYQTLLMSWVIPLFDPVSLTISGLTIGAQYQFQFWSNDSSDQFSYQITATAGNSITLGSNDGHANGGLGEWVIGSFTADATSQSFSFLGDGGFLNGFQLRQIPTGNAVPESGGTFALLGLALAGLFLAQPLVRQKSR
ncbi:MAG: hypothetical protein ACXV8H_06615 [Chthoniobacterales bacterium]